MNLHNLEDAELNQLEQAIEHLAGKRDIDAIVKSLEKLKGRAGDDVTVDSSTKFCQSFEVRRVAGAFNELLAGSWYEKLEYLVSTGPRRITVNPIMKPIFRCLFAAFVVIATAQVVAEEKNTSGNPVFEGWYADPEGVIFGDTYWIYPTYSAPYDKQVFFDCFSSKDLVTWEKHSRILDADRR